MRSIPELTELLNVKLSDNQITKEELRDAACELHYALRNSRPPIESQNPIIGRYDKDNKLKPDANNVPLYYLNHKRVQFLLDWTVKYLPIIQILEGKGKLPFSRKPSETDYEAFVKSKINAYVDQIKIYKDNLSKLGIPTFLSDDDLSIIEFNCKDLLEAIGKYLDGLPDMAYNALKKCMDRIESNKLKPFRDKKDPNGDILFKMRLGEAHRFYSADNMFHIPFESRGLVKTNRYSIPGLPCVYLGSTTVTCWEEMGRPDLDSTHTSLFLTSKKLTYYNLSVPPTAMAEFLKDKISDHYGGSLRKLYEMVRAYLVLWPLIACCSIKVKNPNDSFKPEYIVSQLLLQWIQQSRKYDGIRYFSTKINNYTFNNFQLYSNYAFPVKARKGKGQCNKLRKKFTYITKAVPWQAFQIHKSLSQEETTPSEKFNMSATLELIPGGIEIPYKTSDFGRLETYLVYQMEKETEVKIKY
ncbi:RES domain-containing protein [Paenibacillus alvei]|uniref:RES domain-containing protein n=1 Tax=Paenibacillus alvei TaxID=44250 RepID=A0ABT4H3H5_PAEAL|nr:RES domain-containing protein [Paenibacillus alvei]MCY9763194.1 RES domain-containing protein [Paenibacillus alvei]MCY9769517.1 RES domain-containing protein [Paenibacillus alvei]